MTSYWQARTNGTGANPIDLENVHTGAVRTSPPIPGGPRRSHASISASLLTGFGRLARSLGGNPDELLAHADLGEFSGPHLPSEVPFRNFANLLETGALVLGTPDFGMRLAETQSTFGTWLSHLKDNSVRTVLDLKQCRSEYSRLRGTAIQTHLERFSKLGDHILLYSCVADGAALRRQAIEYIVASHHREVMRLSRGRSRTSEVLFAHERLASPPTYFRHFGCNVRFSEPFDASIWTAADLSVNVVIDDKPTDRCLERVLPKALPKRVSISSRVRREVDRAVQLNSCCRDSVASAIGLHPRTLHRRLRDEGTRFEVIRDTVRRELAARYIFQSEIPFTEVSSRIGFAEPSVLTRACWRWFGRPPSELRQKQPAQTNMIF